MMSSGTFHGAMRSARWTWLSNVADNCAMSCNASSSLTWHGLSACVLAHWYATLMPKASSSILCVHARTGEVASPLGLDWGGEVHVGSKLALRDAIGGGGRCC